MIFAEEPAVHAWSGLWNIWLSPADIERGRHYYWPIVYPTFWLEYKLWGLAPFRCAGRLDLATVFAVHPVHVESVAWIIERKDLLSGLFYTASAAVAGRRRRWSGAAWSCGWRPAAEGGRPAHDFRLERPAKVPKADWIRAMRTNMALEDNRARCRLREQMVDCGLDKVEAEWALATPPL